MRRKGSAYAALGIILIMTVANTFSGCGPVRAAEQVYTPDGSGERYKNSIEIDGQWQNSVWMPEGSIYGIGDPFVMRYNGKYYLYPSTADGRGGIKVYESTDLVNWTYRGFAVAESEPTSVGAYAPEVVYYNGYFYMCQSRAGQGHYIYRSESPTEGFTLVSTSELPEGDLNRGNLGMGIDGSFYISDDGELYLLHTSTPSGLKYNKITDVSSITPSTLGPTKTLGDANLLGWIEGPGIIRRGEYTYLTYTGNHVISHGYRVAYSYAKDLPGLSEFSQPRDNVTLIDTDPEHRGLGHSSNFYGPDLDSIYTAYHNLVGGGPSRRYNLDRYLTNGGVLTANGITHSEVLAPVRPTAEIRSGAELPAGNGIYSLGTTAGYFTAEFNFYPNEDQALCFGENYKITLNGGKIRLTRGGELLDEKEISYPAERLNTVRIENGDGIGYIYLNGMRVILYDAAAASGDVGYISREGVEYTAFTNDVFGTSDFEALKNFPSKFPATSYLKGEGRGFSILGAEVVPGGLRVGEKQSLVALDEDDCFAVALSAGDWVKYGIDVPESGIYSVAARITKKSAGVTLKITAEEESFTCTLPETLTSGGETLKVSLGNIALEKGAGAMKVEVISGYAELVSLETYANAEAPESVSLKDFSAVRGNVTVGDAAVMVIGEEDHSVALWGNSGACNFETELKFTCTLDNSSDLGIMIRVSDYSYYKSQPVQSWRGYYLKIGQHLLTLSRYDYGEELLGALRIGDVFADPETEHTLKIIADSNELYIILDGEYEIRATDDCAFLSGQLGLYATSGELTLSGITYSAK